MVGWPSGSGRHDERFVPPAVVPGAGEGDFAVTLLPHLGFCASANQRETGAGHDGDIGAAHDFEQAQGVRYFFIPPRVSADDRDAEDVDLRGLDQKRERLHIAAAGAGAVFVDDDFAAGLGGAEDG